jgi:hypothetical protein
MIERRPRWRVASSGDAIKSARRAPELRRAGAERGNPDFGRGHLERELGVPDGGPLQLIRAPALILELEADPIELASSRQSVRRRGHEVRE